MARTPFSVLLPVYHGDRPDFFTEAFASTVLEQSRSPDEVVIVRDGPVSPELDAAIAAAVTASPVPTKLVALASNVGLASALTAGLSACEYDVVARIDADDLSMPQRFERQLPLIDAGYDLVGAGMLEFAGSIHNVVGRRVPVTGASIGPYARFHDPFNHPTVVYRRSVVDAAGGYRSMGLMEDYWLFARMIHAGARVANIAEPLVGYRVDHGAYRRRGGLAQLVAECRLQREFRRTGFTSTGQFVRNLVVRGAYRLVPVSARRRIYRRYIAEQRG